MVSKVYAFFLNEEAQSSPIMDAFRSCAQGTGVGGVHLGKTRTRKLYSRTANPAEDVTIAQVWDEQPGILSYQF